MSRSPLENRQFHLRRRPRNALSENDFEIRGTPLPTPRTGELLLRNVILGIDPAIRQWIAGRGRYIAPIAPGDPVRAIVLGEVMESALDGFAPGDIVRALGTWGEHSLVSARDFPFRIPSADRAKASEWLGVLGSAGLAAYFGLFAVGRPEPGESVLVSSAAGAVGSIVCQLAKLSGCHVAGVSRSATKREWLLNRLKIDAVVELDGAGTRAKLRAACPDGVDVYFDNVGGEMLEAALHRLNAGGRVVICGATSQYDLAAPPRGPANYLCLMEQGARMEGFLASQFANRFPEAISYLKDKRATGGLLFEETWMTGLESAAAALLKVLRGDVLGRMLVRLDQRFE